MTMARILAIESSCDETAVAITDTIQGLIMCVGTFLFLFYVLKAGGGLSGIDAGLSKNLPDVYDNLFSMYPPGTLLSFWILQQVVVTSLQRPTSLCADWRTAYSH